MQPSIFKFVLRYSLREQILLLVFTVVSFPFLYLSLDLPKTIINEAIEGDGFPRQVLGYDLEQLEYLLVLCVTFLALVCLNGAFKYFINVYRGVVGERMLRRLRYELYARVLRFPLPQFRRTSQGELVSMLVAETEPLGGYIGDSIALPAFQGGVLLTILIFMFVQDPVLGTAAIALYPVQAWLIPKLQKKLNNMKKERVRHVRKLSERIGEVVTGIREVHTHDTSGYELADYSDRMGEIYRIRVEIYRLKFFIKFVNNFIAQITPFFFFLIGGYLVIEGDLSFGALVAVLGAYKDLSDPWKELLNFYQIKEDARVKYELLLESFQPGGMLGAEKQGVEPDVREPLAGQLVASNLDLKEDDEGETTFAGGMSFTTDLPASIALVGSPGSGTDRLAQILSGVKRPSTGKLLVEQLDLSDAPEAITGRQVSYVGPENAFFSGTLGENLFYSLKHRPMRDAEYDEQGREHWARLHADATLAGNSEHDIRADWIDYEGAGVSGRSELVERSIDVLRIVDMADDIYQLGLQGAVDPTLHPEFAARILDARRELENRLAEPAIANLVEGFDEGVYNTNMTVAENLLFGTPRDQTFDVDALADNAYVRKVLHETDLMTDFISMGRQVAEVMVDLFTDVPAGSDLFDQYSFISADDLPTFRSLLARTDAARPEDLTVEDRGMLLSLPFKLSPARHRLNLIDARMQIRLVEARRTFAAGFGAGEPPIEFFDRSRYNSRISIQDNILFGRMAYGRARSSARIGDLIREVVEKVGLTREVMEVGLDFPVGISGSRLSGAQRQKLALARAVLKRPDILVVDRATAALDASSQDVILGKLLKEFETRALIWVVHRASLGASFDRTLVIESGKVVEQGSFEDINQPGSALSELVDSE